MLCQAASSYFQKDCESIQSHKPQFSKASYNQYLCLAQFIVNLQYHLIWFGYLIGIYMIAKIPLIGQRVFFDAISVSGGVS
jgi:hypothetical protein